MSIILNNLEAEFLNIWVKNGINPLSNKRIQPADVAQINVPAKSTVNNLIFYGNYCGPGTPNNPSPVPIDCLDFCCMLHDTYFDYPTVDNCLSESVKFLQSKGLIQNSSLLPYVNAIESPLLDIGSTSWKYLNVIVATVISIIIIITSSFLLYYIYKWNKFQK